MSGVEPYGHYFIDDPAKFSMPGGGFKLGPVPPDDCISVIPVYSQATVDTLRAQLEAAVADAARWQHARMLLSIEDIEAGQRAYEFSGRLVHEDECLRADAAIDAARTKEETK